MPFGFHLAMDTLPSGVRLRNSTLFPLSGQRGITPAFGYGAPHPRARGTSTLLNHVLLSTHYAAVRLLSDVPAGRVAVAFARRPAVLVPNRRRRGLPVFVPEVSRRVWGLRLRRTDQGLALAPPGMLPSAKFRASTSCLQLFGAQYPPHLYPCLRFAVHLAMPSAKLGAERVAIPFS